MKVLILTCSTGGGHNACARYMSEELTLNGIDNHIVDYLKLVGNTHAKVAEGAYLASIKGKGGVFNSAYKAAEFYNSTPLKSPVYGMSNINSYKLEHYLEIDKYDLVLSTHLFPTMTLTAINKRGKNIKFINIATDYESIPFYNETSPNFFIIPSPILKSRFIEKGVPEEIIKPLGIPVSSRFIKEAKDVRKDYKINKDDKMILVASGSMGFGGMVDVVQELLKLNAKIVVVCGSNKKVLKELQKIDNPHLIPLGFANNMNDLIYSSDLVLTKPGGLTTTEVASLHKPLIHLMPIPGVETRNANFFEKEGMSIMCKKKEDIYNTAKFLLENPSAQEKMIINQKAKINDHAAHDIVELILNEF